jgi:hypothetical protein
MTNYIINDGGRYEAGFKGRTRDCVVRAVAIATGGDYKTIYNEVNKVGKEISGKVGSARTGVSIESFYRYMKQAGFQFVPLPTTGSGRVNLNNYVPAQGNIVIDVAGHAVASVDGVLHDTFDTRSSKYGKRLVRGYFTLKA